MKIDQNKSANKTLTDKKTFNAPGAGSDKQHAETPFDANKRANTQKTGYIQPGTVRKNTGTPGSGTGKL